MPTGQQLSHQAPSSANGESTPHDLFVLTDEQILEIEPEGEGNLAPSFSPASSPTQAQGNGATPAVIPSEARDRGNTFESSKPPNARQDSSVASLPRNDRTEQNTPSATEHGPRYAGQEAQPGVAVQQEPPPWLATQMKDPWSGEEAKEFWNGVLQARSEAAAYRAAFATPEDARALKELYPGGVNEARAAADRARLLEQVDQAYFGTVGGTPEQTIAARAQLAALMLREDPAAFREMVFAGLRALEEAEKGSSALANASTLPRLAQVFAANPSGAGETRNSKSETRDSQAGSNQQQLPSESNFDFRASSDGHQSPVTSQQSLTVAYSAFEKAANEDLERSVGAAIAHTIERALPNLKGSNRGEKEGARQGVPLQDRLSAAVRQDVEAALKGDRQLGEQIAQILSSRRFDNETRAQVVRLIDDRARQLVPSAARRVINDWTQTTIAAHRGNAARADAVSARTEVLPANTEAGRDTLPASPAKRMLPSQNRPSAGSARPDSRRVDYRKLSDEQILEL